MLEVRDLDAFYGDAQALWGVELDVAAGEIVSIVGSNGAGKSTLVNAIAGIHRARRGEIVVGGVELTALPAHAVCAHGVAMVPEGRRVFAHMTVYDNLCLGAYRQGRSPPLPRRARPSPTRCSPDFRSGLANRQAGSAVASSRCSPSAER